MSKLYEDLKDATLPGRAEITRRVLECHGHTLDRASAVKHVCTELCTINECCEKKGTR